MNKFFKRSIGVLIVFSLVLTVIPMAKGTIEEGENMVKSDEELEFKSEIDNNIVKDNVEDDKKDEDLDGNIIDDTEKDENSDKTDENITENDEKIDEENIIEDEETDKTEDLDKENNDEIVDEDTNELVDKDDVFDEDLEENTSSDIIENAVDGLFEEFPQAALMDAPMLLSGDVYSEELQAFLDFLEAPQGGNYTISTDLVIPKSAYVNNQITLVSEDSRVEIASGASLSFEDLDGLVINIIGELSVLGTLELIGNQTIVLENPEDATSLSNSPMGADLSNGGTINLYDTSKIELRSGSIYIYSNVNGINRTGTGELIHFKKFTDDSYSRFNLEGDITSDIGNGQYIMVIEPDILYEIEISLYDNSIIGGGSEPVFSSYSTRSFESVFAFIENGQYIPYETAPIFIDPSENIPDASGYYTKYYPLILIPTTNETPENYSLADLEAVLPSQVINAQNLTLGPGESFGLTDNQITLSGTMNISEGANLGTSNYITSSYDNIIMKEGSVINNNGTIYSTGSRIILEGDATINSQYSSDFLYDVGSSISSPIIANEVGTKLTLGTTSSAESFCKENVATGQVAQIFVNSQNEQISFASRVSMTFIWDGSNWIYTP